MKQRQPSPSDICELILIEEKRYNTEEGIYPSETAVAERLLARSVELREAYDEIYIKLHQNSRSIKLFLGIILSTAAFWNPEQIAAARRARAELVTLNKKVADMAYELASLLEIRSELHNSSGFTSGTFVHILDPVANAGEENYLFESYVSESLDRLRYQYDLKYWPTLPGFLEALADDAEQATIEATDPLTAAATTGARSSLADFFKALFAGIEEHQESIHGLLPTAFRLTDNTLATIANCALDLSPEDMVDGPYVKRLRQRLRVSK
ncbi:hypothetical protein [Billgrantia ethanolica]|uniref:Uncharacterized protein n=1 Tax=Billgrantia ethanolica TaxID=2733486 RepID=A0ABS9AB55_9GAMM|nr:hypothetical protein [Halomonas ethanolica]MCE8005280.1 hypothetical protein [Halomonas ethanolica]